MSTPGGGAASGWRPQLQRLDTLWVWLVRAAQRAGRWAAAAAPTAVRLLGVLALAAWAAGHWAALLGEPPERRVAAVLVLAGAAAAVVAGSGARGGPAARTVRVAVVLVALVGGLVAVGVPGRLLLGLVSPVADGPLRSFADLAEGIDRGYAGLRTARWPYAGSEPWVRVCVLALVPLLVVPATALAVWPLRDRRRRALARGVALALLVVLFGAATTERAFDGATERGAVLLALIAAWLWLPRLRRRELPGAMAVLAAAALVSLPFASRLEAAEPWVEYESWGIWGGGDAGSPRFDWEHSYGPIRWPRDGRTVLTVRSRRPHYWKVEVLDRFDGRRWARSPVGREAVTAELPRGALELDSRWRPRLRFGIRDLRSARLPVAGVPLELRGVGLATVDPDGTTELAASPLDGGEEYGIEAYVPEPSDREMRGVPDTRDESLRSYTDVGLPSDAAGGGGGADLSLGAPGDADRGLTPGSSSTATVAAFGLRGAPAPADRFADAATLRSPYAGVLPLARRLAAGAPTTLDAARRIERHLRQNYDYSETPPVRAHPLAAFLLEDRVGYCQQFSGAMALMLRMNGVPARVVSGFAPGVFLRERSEYRVRDLDAHSWVEVHFEGIGWVAFDPTPPAAPAELQTGDAALGQTQDAAGGGGGGAAGDGGDPGADGAAESPEPSEPARAGDGSGAGGRHLVLAVAAVLAGAAGLAVVRRRRARPSPSVEADLAALTAALRRLGWSVPEATTLSALERRLAAVAGPEAAGEVRRLRERRYGQRGDRAAHRLDRRALRRALGAGRGPLGRLRALAALPPAAR